MNPLKIWKNRKLIAEGIANSIFKKDSVEEIAEARMGICKTCPNIDMIGDSCELPGTQPCCSLCGCTLKLKTRSLAAACDDNRWDAILTPDEQEEVYTKTGFNPHG